MAVFCFLPERWCIVSHPILSFIARGYGFCRFGGNLADNGYVVPPIVPVPPILSFRVLPVPPIDLTPVRPVVDCSSVRHCGTVYRSPRRIRGHTGSASYRPDESAISSIPGYDRLARLSAERRLEILGTMLLHVESVSAAWRRMRDTVNAERVNSVGFGGVTDRLCRRRRGKDSPLPRVTTLRDVIATMSPESTDSLLDSAEIHLNRLKAGFGSYWRASEDMGIAAKLAGISQRSAERILKSFRDSWRNAPNLVRYWSKGNFPPNERSRHDATTIRCPQCCRR